MRRSRLALLVPAACLPLLALAAPEVPKGDYNPPVAKASDEAQKAIPRFKIDKGLKVEVWAAEPMVANPVAFAFDEKGVCYVAETFRMHHGVTDNRGHMNWLDDDLAARTVADRVAIYKKDAKDKFAQTYEKERDRVRRLEDTDGDGKADKVTVFRDDFGRAEDGLGSGVLARKGSVYFTNIPDLWVLKDTKGTGTADVKESLSTGYGVHTSFIGHDLHGLRMGPDGRLYFSLGDRGMNVTTKEGRKLFLPDTGAVLRCEPDGSNLEVFATGLRNPQELAFDDFGNLFTVDNNSDSGDQARFLHIVEGGDYGWRIGYQYETRMHDETVKQGNRGPWNYEQLWKPDAQAAYLLPALRNFANGPSGFTAYPGVGLSDRYKGHFFLANFSGSPPNSGIFSFGVKPKGATFEMTDDHKFVWDVLATDCEFGPDGAFYVSDWVDGWGLPGKGRIYRITDPEAMKDPAVAEAKKLIAEGMDKRPVGELVKLLGHRHREVRLEAQYALAAKGKDSIESLMGVAGDQGANRLARLHALWGLGMIVRKWDDEVGPDRNLLRRGLRNCHVFLQDSDPEVRAQAARVLGDAKSFPTQPPELPASLLNDPEPRVRLSVALAIGHMAGPGPPPPFPGGPDRPNEKLRDSLFRMVRENDGKDAYLRHAGSLALAGCFPSPMIAEAADDRSPVVRIAAVVALRRQKAPQVAAFLSDSDPKVVAEAARAISDEVITPALPKLAALLTQPDLPRVVAYRALNAHYLLGKRENASTLAAYATRSDAPESLRALAVRMLGEWATPPRRDYITGLTQALPPRPREDAVSALAPGDTLSTLAHGPKAVRAEFVAAVSKLELKEAGPTLAGMVTDEKGAPEVRVEALKTLAAFKDPLVEETAAKAMAATEGRVRNAGRAVLFKQNPAAAVKELRGVLAGTDTAEKQGVFPLLVANPSADTDGLLEEWLDKVADKTAPPELWLDVLEAAGASKSERIKRRLAGYENSRPKGDDLAKFREALAGGDAARGKDVFLKHTAAQCQRCHQLNGQGGEVGPPVNGAGKQTREYLLEAIVLPSKAIAKGYESVLITTLDGKTVSGVLKGEDDKEVRLMTAEAKLVVVKKADIDDRRATKSAMTDDLVGKLSKRELRDLVEFLSGLKAEWKK